MARKIRKVDPAYLRRVALWYLERWEAPTAGLRRILHKRVIRSVKAHGTDPEEASAWVEEIIEEAVAARLVDDERFARQAIARGRSAGKSTRQLHANLRGKGLSREVIERAMKDFRSDHPDEDDRIAALRYARRRRFGPWRLHPADPDRQRKELASLARRGFSYPVARQIVDQSEEDRADAEDALLYAQIGG